MAIDFMDLLKEAFEGLDSLNADQIRRVLVETNVYFDSLQNVLLFGNPTAKEEALANALELKEFLDAKAANENQFKGLGTLSLQEQEIISEIDNSLISISGNKNKTNIKKLKPTKLR